LPVLIFGLERGNGDGDGDSNGNGNGDSNVSDNGDSNCDNNSNVDGHYFFWNSEFWTRNSDFSIFQQRNSKKNPTGTFGIENGIEIPAPMGVPDIRNWNQNRNSQPSGKVTREIGWLGVNFWTQTSTRVLLESKQHVLSIGVL
jgi:hypothetical protein